MDIAATYAEHPLLVIVGFFLITQALLYAARVPIHRALRSAGLALGGAFRLLSKWCRVAADKNRERNRELLLEAGRVDIEKKLEREFLRVSDGFAKELRGYPDLHRKLDESATKITTDLEASAASPPRAPAWPNAVQAVTNIPDVGDPSSRKVLDEIKNMALGAEKKALKEYRDATAKRHRILAGMAHHLKAVKGNLTQTFKAVSTALETATRVDGYMDRYDKIRQGEDATARTLASDHVSLFLISFVITAIAVAGAFVNFHLIALPMSELVPAGSRVAGTPVSTVAALVIVLMEVAAGIFVMDALGITELLPRIGRLSTSQRRFILTIGLTGLFLLAAIESSLAILREHIVEADLVLKQSLAGEAGAIAKPVTSSIPVIGQAVLGFILPWILAMIALPLEMLVNSGRHVVGAAVAWSVEVFGTLARLAGHGCRYTASFLIAVFDVYIILPLQLERLTRRRGTPDNKSRARIIPNPTDRTGEHGVMP